MAYEPTQQMIDTFREFNPGARNIKAGLTAVFAQMELTNQDAFRMFMARIGMEWEQPEPTTTGACFEVPAMGVYFDDDGDFLTTEFRTAEELEL